ncbi:unnamed protein product [Malus baccata var. baccata]
MNDEETQELIQTRSQGKKKDLRIRKTNGMLMQESWMYVPNIAELKKDILDEAHISAYVMHPGSTKMYHTIKPFYYWPGMKREIAEYPLPVPQWKWENITMAFVYKLPHTRNGYDGIWVIVDRLTKSAHFIPVREKYSFSRLVELFISRIVKYHGVPISIISDRDPRSTYKFWVAFQEALGWRLFYSMAYHPQTDGQSERTIQTLEDMLRLSVIKSNLKVAQDRQKSLVDKHATDRVYKVGDWVFLKLSPWKGVGRFGKKDPSHVIPLQPLKIIPDLNYDEQPVTILDWKDKVLRNKTVRLVKVLWRNHLIEATWEMEDHMRDMYPHLFYEY